MEKELERRGSGKGVAAVDRALLILSAFQDGEPHLGLADLASRTGLYKSTILRLCISLEAAGYVRRLEDGRFRLGPQLLKLGTLYEQSLDVGDVMKPELRRLADESGESVSFYVRDGDMRLCLYRVNSLQHRILHYIRVGTQLPLDSGASGRIITVHTDSRARAEERRETCFTLSLRRRAEATAAMAAAVFGVEGFAGAISLAGPLDRFTARTIPGLAKLLLEAAIRASKLLGGELASLDDARRQLLGDEEGFLSRISRNTDGIT